MTLAGLRQVLAGWRRAPRTAGWQPLARSADVGHDVLVCRPAEGHVPTLLVWRTRNGRPIAMDARCPHRQLPMTGGRVVDDSLECPFHHRRFGPTGRCVNVRGVRPATVLKVNEVAGTLWLEVRDR